ncbi:MAG: hypothetical protein EHM47_16935, partial [Ignavibacteriales bacterium]
MIFTIISPSFSIIIMMVLAGILRSPFFNLSDSKLYEISQSAGFSFYQKLLAAEDETLKTVKEKLTEMTAMARFKDAPELLRKMLNDSDLTAYLSSKRNGAQETANLRKLVKVTINFYTQGFRTLYDYVYFLKTGIEQIEDESQALIADDSNTVKIMTIHQAKGLEFPVIFLYKSGESAQKSIVRQKSLFVNKQLGILTKVPLNENYYEDYISPHVVNLNNFIALKKNNAELKRLLYVGITRAMDYLYITAAKKDSYPADSFMGLLSRALPAGFTQSSFSISGELKYLKNDGEKFSLSEQEIRLDIPVITEVKEIIIPKNDTAPLPLKILTGEIQDSVKDEIISATRYAVFNHCPLKYKFTYIDGLLPLVKVPRNKPESEETEDDFIIAGAASIKGRIIHKLLQEGKDQADSKIIKNLIRKEEPEISENAAEKLSCEIVNDLNIFFSSRIYNEIKNLEGQNEYEIYFSENGYILYGIIDKLIIKDNIITIIDYKTDDIPEEKISERAEEYLNQLKFYSYIIWNTFNFSYRILFKIIFIRHPDKYFEKEESQADLTATGAGIREMVEKTRNNIFNPDR